VEVVVPAGTALDIEFDSPIASNTVAGGSTFATRVTNDILVGEVLAIPAGALVHGTVTEAVPAKKIGGQARLALSFDHLKLATGEQIPIAAAFAVATKSQTGKDAATIGGAAAGGAVLGNVLDWATNVGYPGYATAAIDEVFNTFVIPTMFAKVARDELSPEDAARAAEKEMKRIFDKWK